MAMPSTRRWRATRRSGRPLELIDVLSKPSDLVSDARLAALAIEHGEPVASADTDFARFPEVTWVNPLAP